MDEVYLKKQVNDRYSNIRFSDDCISDITEIINESGNELSFLKKFWRTLNILDEYKDMAPIKMSKLFESLKGHSNLYIHENKIKIEYKNIIFNRQKRNNTVVWLL
ncbi:hypothetical protein DWX71_07495 [Ruminococcus bromii]|nr:hypothetical protein DWX71_07495 [Ruminococcus bromii]